MFGNKIFTTQLLYNRFYDENDGSLKAGHHAYMRNHLFQHFDCLTHVLCFINAYSQRVVILKEINQHTCVTDHAQP